MSGRIAPVGIAMRSLLVSLVLALSPGLDAREVDNHMAWGVDLEDAGPAIDEYMRAKMREAIETDTVAERELPPEDADTYEEVFEWYASCYGTVERLLKDAYYSPTYQKIEEYIDAGDGLDIYPRRPDTKDDDERARLGQTPDNGYMTNREYIEASIVGSSPFNVPMSRIVNVYGVYTGADKFGHFTSFGRRYLKQFVKLLEDGVPPEEAFDQVMEDGYSSEESVVGMMFTNVFSRGDLEANFQGMRFAWSLCRSESAVRLTFDGAAWGVENLDAFTIRNYVNPNWDESYHNSIFSEDTWEENVTHTFAARDQCAALDTPWLSRQRAHYATLDDESTNTRYGDTWIPENFEGMSAADHSLERYCESERLAALAPMAPAESGNPLPRRDDEWRFTIAFPMVWTPDINGKIRGGETIDFTISFKDILENLSFGLMFELYANRGPYGLAFRSNFMRVEDENSRSGLLDTRVNTTLDMGVNDLLASFRVHDKLRLVTGVRHVFAKLDVDIYSTLGDFEILDETITVTDDNMFDLLLGINFNHWINDKWGLMLNADLGVAGDNDRNYSAEFRALYRISDLNNFWFGYRYLNIGNDSTEGDVTYEVDMIQQGLTLGWAFTF
jgi:hypothetical protein